MTATPSLDEIEAAAAAAARALADAGYHQESGTIEVALLTAGRDAEWLLAVREALVMTRVAWEGLDGPVRARTAAALGDAKRLAIEL